MRLLVLGGTKFLGRHVVEEALRRQHDVTLFHRGRTNVDLFPAVERVLGDRDGGLTPLRGRAFDAVIDTCGYVPRIVRESARLLADTCGHYTFVSTGSVYPMPVATGTDESATVGTLDDPTVETVDGVTYGPLKALCEDQVRTAFPGRAAVIRAGLIVGPHDPTDRFTYWPLRMARGGEVLCPPRADQPVQFIDVRDIAAWMLHIGEQRVAGTFNATGPAQRLEFGALLDACRAIARPASALVWPDAAFLTEHDVELWGDLPLAVDAENFGFMQVSNARARAAGLAFRPLEETVRATLEWAAGRELQAGISAEREAEVLRAWHARESRS